MTEDEEFTAAIRGRVHQVLRIGWFGSELARPRRMRALVDEVALCRDGLVDVLDNLHLQLDGGAPSDLQRAPIDQVTAVRADVAGVEPVDPARPFEIVLVGSKGVGKSTLMDFLTRGDGSLIGDAPESATDQPERYELSETLTIVNTPGIGDADAAHTRASALAAARQGDLVVWVLDSGSFDDEVAALMGQIASSGRPVALLCNVKATLSFRTRTYFARMSQRSFAEADPVRERSRQILAEVGQTPILDIATNLALLNLSRIMRIRRVPEGRIYSAFQGIAPESEWKDPRTKQWNRPELLDSRPVITRWAKGEELLRLIEAAQSGSLDSFRDFSMVAELRQSALQTSVTCTEAAQDLRRAASDERAKPVEQSGRILGKRKASQASGERERSASAVEGLAQACADAAAAAADSVRNLDAQLYRSLLGRNQLWRLRDGLIAVSRKPGRGALIAYADDDLFFEANLFAPAWVPEWITVEPMRPTPNPANVSAVIAHGMGVGRWPGSIIMVTAEHIDVRLATREVPETEPMWADLVQDMIATGGPLPTVSVTASGAAR
ncbi:MAG: GTPase domain-containing protein [Actinomycetes bacterium]